MVTKSRKSVTVAKARKRTVRRSGNQVRRRTRSAVILRGGVTTLGGTIRLALAGIEDMLDESIDSREAAVINRAVGRVLKATELHLKYGDQKRGSKSIRLPQ